MRSQAYVCEQAVWGVVQSARHLSALEGTLGLHSLGAAQAVEAFPHIRILLQVERLWVCASDIH
eukprot:15477471-Alexandrium_andersonii.AAC.1